MRSAWDILRPRTATDPARSKNQARRNVYEMGRTLKNCDAKELLKKTNPESVEDVACDIIEEVTSETKRNMAANFD